MRARRPILLVAGLLVLTPPAAGEAQPITAFVGVDVVPMDRERVLEERTVIVRGDHIARIGRSATTEIPAGARIIEGHGRYLMPGLADMHVHIWNEGDLSLYVANGVTTIRNMAGAALHLDWRARIAKGELFGPTIFTTGPIIDGNPPGWSGSAVVETPAQAAAVVAEQKQAGYDFVKVYSHLSREAYDGILAAARAQAMPVVGHVPDAVGLEEALTAGHHCIEHIDAYGSALEATPPTDGANAFVRMVRAWEHGAMERIPALARKTAKARAWVCPTLGVFDGRLAPQDVAAVALGRPEVRYVWPVQLRDWKSTEGHAETYRSFVASKNNRDRMTKALWDAGQRILLGSDTANPFLVAGFSIHDELHHLVEAGLTPYEALSTGTRKPAEFLGRLDEFGTIAEGRRADLILLEANPLEDVAHVRARVGVMLRGTWLPEAELERRLEALAEGYASGGSASAQD